MEYRKTTLCVPSDSVVCLLALNRPIPLGNLFSSRDDDDELPLQRPPFHPGQQ